MWPVATSAPMTSSGTPRVRSSPALIEPWVLMASARTTSTSSRPTVSAKPMQPARKHTSLASWRWLFISSRSTPSSPAPISLPESDIRVAVAMSIAVMNWVWASLTALRQRAPSVLVIDVVLNAVVANVGAIQPLQPTMQRVADPARVRQQAAVDEVNDRPRSAFRENLADRAGHRRCNDQFVQRSSPSGFTRSGGRPIAIAETSARR